MGNENFRCTVCDTVGKWKSVDEFRYKASGMCMCESCGFVTYPAIQQNSKDLTEFYREEYREAPSVNNMFSGERKLHYHAEFLSTLFNEWKEKDFKNPKVLEIGAAFGMFLSWVKQVLPGAEVAGTELTTSFRRNAWWMFGIRLDEMPDLSKKYDLICSYKVAEHIPEIDKELRKYALALTEKGQLYISVPTWFGSMCNFGLGGFSLEYYYHKNHINVWSRALFEECLRKAGLRVVKFNDTHYDDTYLCVRDDSVMALPAHKDSPEKRLEQLKHIHEAAKAFDLHDFDYAISLWSDFPDAHINRYEKSRGKLHKLGWEHIKKEYLDRALRECPTSAYVLNFVGDLHMRYEKFEEALKVFEKNLEHKPNDPQALIAVGHCYRQMAAKSKSAGEELHWLNEAREVMNYLQKTSKQLNFDAITWMMQDNSKIPAPFESLQDKPVIQERTEIANDKLMANSTA